MKQKVFQQAPLGLRRCVKPKAEVPYDVPGLDHPFRGKSKIELGTSNLCSGNSKQLEKGLTATREHD
jgi:hypothetical protein